MATTDAPPSGIDLDKLFRKKSVFDSASDMEKAGFNVLRGKQDKIFVATHRGARRYIFKKFGRHDYRSYGEQIAQYQQRVEGARLLREHISAHQITRIVAPRKWLCALPSRFDTRKGPSYIVIADYFKILDREESADAYKRMGTDQTKELCSILFTFGRLDFCPQNAPFDREGRIVWVDTERVRLLKPKLASHKRSYEKNIHRTLSGKPLRIAEDLWDDLAARSGLDKKKKRSRR